MNIELNNYYVNIELQTLFASKGTTSDRFRMNLPSYMKGQGLKYRYPVYKKGNYYINKTSSFKDIVQKVEDNDGYHDSFIFDLFQLSDFTLNTFYDTAKSKNEDVKINLGTGCEINIYFEKLNETLKYPILSINQANSVSNKIHKLNKILEGY